VITIDFDQIDKGSGCLNEISIQNSFRGKTALRVIQFEHDGKVPEPNVLDGYVLSIIFDAMQTGSKIRVKGSVSSAAIRNFSHLGEAWQNMSPALYRPVEIDADHIVSDGAIVTTNQKHEGLDRAILTFSGGLDSHFTAMRHSKKYISKYYSY
jgi:hypothetical protein